jgi:chromate reductase
MNENNMATLIGLSGSLRTSSFNTALLRAAAGLMPEGTQLLVSRAGGVFDAEGHLVDEGVKKRLQEFLEGFAEYVQTLAR